MPIAAAVTAYARCNIYEYKKYVVDAGGVLYYSDTDSIFASIPLHDSMVSSELGAMKLEYVGDAAIFLAPKVYIVKLADGYKKTSGATKDGLLIKIKGAKKDHGLVYDDFEALLFAKSEHAISTEKWYRSFTNSTISIKKTLYTLKVTESKRALIYTDHRFVYTKPFVVKDHEIVNS